MFSNLQERNAPLHAGFQFIQPVYTVPICIQFKNTDSILESGTVNWNAADVNWKQTL